MVEYACFFKFLSVKRCEYFSKIYNAIQKGNSCSKELEALTSECFKRLNYHKLQLHP